MIQILVNQRRSRRSRLVLFPMKYRPQATTAPNFLGFLARLWGSPFRSPDRRMGRHRAHNVMDGFSKYCLPAVAVAVPERSKSNRLTGAIYHCTVLCCLRLLP